MRMGLCILGVVMPLLFLSAATGTSAPRPLETVRINGREYVSATQWAASKGLSARWVRREESLQLSADSGSTVLLKADAREATINGVQVWLSYPIARSGGSLFIT